MPMQMEKTNFAFRCWLPLTLMVMATVGCGPGGPPLANVTGTVTLDGKPVPNALVTFNSMAENGSPSFGKTDKQGRYALEFSTDRKGALLGQHEVEITTQKISKSELPDDGSVKETEFVAIPKHYTRGTLTAEVKSGSNVCDFALSSKPK